MEVSILHFWVWQHVKNLILHVTNASECQTFHIAQRGEEECDI
jgi:hypothetical protein